MAKYRNMFIIKNNNLLDINEKQVLLLGHYPGLAPITLNLIIQSVLDAYYGHHLVEGVRV